MIERQSVAGRIFNWIKLYITKGQTSLRVRFTLWLQVFTFLTMLVIAVSVVLYINQAELSYWRKSQNEAADNAAEKVERSLQSAKQVISLVAMADRSYLEGNPDFIASILAEESSFFEIVRLNHEGEVVAEAHRGTPLLSNMLTTLQSQWFINARQGAQYFGDLRLSTLSEPYLILSEPAEEGDVVAVRLRMDVLQEAVNSIHFSENSNTYIMNLDGQIIAHSDSSVVLLGTSIKNQPEYKEILQSSNYSWYGRYVNLEGERVMGSSVMVENTQWILVTEVAESEVSRGSWLAGYISGILALVLAAILSQWFRYLMDTMFFRPLNTLQKAADQLGQGNLDHRIHMQRHDEMGRVANTFDMMAERLQEREQELAENTYALEEESTAHQQTAEELRRLNEELEQRVEQRTGELQAILKRIMLLNRVIYTGSAILEPTHILEVLCREMAMALNLPQAAYAAADKGGKTFSVIAEYLQPGRPSSMGFHIPVEGNQLVERVLETRRPVIINTDQYDPLLAELKKEINRRGIKAMLLVPLVLRDREVGTLGLDSIEERQFNEEDVELAMSVTTAAGQVYENARLYTALQKELEERKRFEDILLFQSTHDGLTGLYNRSFFEEEMKRLQHSRQYPISIIMIDLDNLKSINDTLGHAVGDDYLKRSAAVFRSTFRNEDVVARIGGDEFAVMLPGIDPTSLQTVIQRLNMLLDSHNANCSDRPVQLSIGTATAFLGDSLMKTLRQADQDMYREKSAKRMNLP